MKIGHFVFIGLCFMQLCLCVPTQFKDCSDDSEAFLWLQQNIESGKPFDKGLISLAVQRGWWRTCEEIITMAKERNMDITSAFYRAQSIVKNNLSKLQAMFSKKEDWAVISPAFQWAQGQRTISLNVKFAHKWDTPATLGCSLPNITFQANIMRLETKCPSTHKKFILIIPTYKDLIPDDCKLADSSVGRVVVSLRKLEPGFWSDLYKDHKLAPRNMHTWWSMKEQLSKEDEEIKKEEEKKKAELKKKQEEEEKKRKEEEEEKKKSNSWYDHEVFKKNDTTTEESTQETINNQGNGRLSNETTTVPTETTSESLEDHSNSTEPISKEQSNKNIMENSKENTNEIQKDNEVIKSQETENKETTTEVKEIHTETIENIENNEQQQTIEVHA
ncbi:hypothetical protein WA158_001356 [Blastocystis sp. Blastoise]